MKLKFRLNSVSMVRKTKLSRRMKRYLSKYSIAGRYGYNFFIPFTLILTFIAVLSTIQYYNFHTDETGLIKLANILAAKIIYFFFYLLLLFPVFYKFYYKNSFLYRIGYNLFGLIIFLAGHQLISLSIDYIFLGKSHLESFINLLINNKAVWVDIGIYTFFLILIHLMEYKSVIHKKELEQSQLEVNLVKTKLTELRVKIQPDFLFNTLKSIDSLIKKEEFSLAEEKLGLLSDFLRISIYSDDNEKAALKEEIRFLELYSDIERLSLGDRYILDINFDNKIESALVPGFLIQPLIQELVNKIKETDSIIRIELSVLEETGYLNISIKLIDLPDVIRIEESNIYNYSRERLERIYSSDYNLRTERNSGNFSIIRIVIPFERDNNT